MTETTRMVSREMKRLFMSIRVRRNIKDVLFHYIFKDKSALLLLYNALNGSNYQDTAQLQITTFENAIYMSFKNDVSFIIENVVNLYEHQSTLNPNLPVRGLLYFAQQYELLLDKKNLYSRQLVKLPTPCYIVFYNGTEDAMERSELRLSDAFIKKVDSPALEVKATMININFNHYMDLLNSSRPLYDYSYFINMIRKYQQQGYSYRESVDKAADYCIKNDILKELLETHKGEVRKMLLTEYNPKKHIKMERKEAHEEGFEEGLSIGISAFIQDNLEEGIAPERIIIKLQKRFNLSEEQAKEYLSNFPIGHQ